MDLPKFCKSSNPIAICSLTWPDYYSCYLATTELQITKAVCFHKHHFQNDPQLGLGLLCSNFNPLLLLSIAQNYYVHKINYFKYAYKFNFIIFKCIDRFIRVFYCTVLS